MPVAMLQEMEGMTAEMHDAVAAQLGVEENPPQGMLLHTAGYAADGRFRIFDVWESRDAFERFREERLLPAVRTVVGEEAIAAGPPPQEVYDLHAFAAP